MSLRSTLDSPLLNAQELEVDERQEFESICSNQRTTPWLTFVDGVAEKAYRKWQAKVFERDVRMGLLLSNFLFFLVAVVYACW